MERAHASFLLSFNYPAQTLHCWHYRGARRHQAYLLSQGSEGALTASRCFRDQMKGVSGMEQKKRPHASHKVGEYPLFFKHDVLEELRLAEHAQEEAYFHRVNQALLAALRQQDTTQPE